MSDPRTPLLLPLDPEPRAWVADTCTRIGTEPQFIESVFPAVGRRCGRTAADDVRAALLLSLPQRGQDLASAVTRLFRLGDAAEQRAVLKALPYLEDADPSFGALGLALVQEALRSNDTTLVEAALGPYAIHLDPHAFRQAVLKCLFCEIPLTGAPGYPDRVDDELLRMLNVFAQERIAAGRPVPAGIQPLVRDVLQASTNEGTV
ncbi:EboA domain-containing protein [Streptomyces spongiae]|uniref:Sugar phosphate isomerase n=1 Tax=Streptomyces spongiae TaxID=565072 RepID=A0A5N8X8V1_9ACTN|nr:EboA domain-containing protein [Streptomyces spongiae]MPY55930.1 hypothetical protein [Streptomyces spongiae]